MSHNKKRMIRILDDEEITSRLSTETVVSLMAQTLRAKAEGALIAPSRFSIDVGSGGLVFTTGAEIKYSQSMGFRVYDTFHGSGDHDQLVIVYESQTGVLQGLIIGKAIGALRTAGINAVAIQYMARQDASTLGILGSGFQARYHMRAASVVRQFRRAKIYSPTAYHRESFASEMSVQTGIPTDAASSPEEVVRFADVLICATRSTTPVFEAGWVKPGTHVNTIGPKFKGMAEVPYELAQKSQVIATDSLEQAASYPSPFFLLDTPAWERMVNLSEIVTGNKEGRQSPTDITLFCSVGLAGTEVVIAREALRLARPA